MELARSLYYYEHKMKAEIYLDRLPLRINMLELEKNMENYRRIILNSKKLTNEQVLHMDEFIMDTLKLSAK
eukprot:CAMPEP_0170547894 /NCGR_PEP_ID=MMETSP0211-20121228/6208_1 /TAXON_ID=311385 /ORGANISM="Pseudokeronopsis sp., Strain OXSARD2" /LENGTH=70 /DNA_ID=CAMNT_0010853111 /DNA_START=164 /DNA_END=376 /DNA_ORIENTATION=-